MNNVDEARSIINEVLSRSEFQPEKQYDLSFMKKIQNLIEEAMKFVLKIITGIIEAFGKLIKAIFGNIFKSSSGGAGGENSGLPIFTIIIIILFIVLLILIIFFMVKKFKRKRRDDVVPLLDKEIETFITETDMPFRLAEKYRLEGNYRMSFRYVFISLLIQLNKREIIRIDKARTNRQYLLEIRESRPEISEDFFQFAEAFAFHWYGLKDISAPQLDIWLARYKTILEGGAGSDGSGEK